MAPLGGKMGIVLGVLALFAGATLGANILVFISVGGYSHRIVMQGLLDNLAEKGHHVTVLSAFPAKVPNPRVEDLTPPKLLEWHEGWSEDIDLFGLRKSPLYALQWFLFYSMGVNGCRSLYADPTFLAWLRDPRTKVDLILFDVLCSECIYGVAHHFGAKLVGFNSAQVYPWDPEAHWGLPEETSSLRDVMWNMPVEMSFFQRAVTAMMPLVWKVFREGWVLPEVERVTKEGMGWSQVPSFKEIEQNVSLYLVNNNWAQEHARSFPPNVVPVGGIAWARGREAKPLPKYVEEFLGKGKEGFIYLSFGSLAEFTKFGEETRQAFLEMPRKFPGIRFLWRAGLPLGEELPENVLVDKWFPQMDILAHPEIRLFITHGGLGGIYEGILNKVPMLCCPLFAEQEYNADLMVYKGFGRKLEITTVTGAELTAAIQTMLSDPSYKRQIERVSALFSDRPMNPLDTATWWVEFVLRHENTNEFLRPLSVTQAWWVRRQLDVWAFVGVTMVMLIGGSFYGLWFCAGRICKIGRRRELPGNGDTTRDKGNRVKRD